MDNHNELGKLGESLAESWLTQNGYEILFRNWQYRKYEIDILAEKDDVLHIIEVKTRHATPFGNPEDSVTRKKFSFLKRAAHEFIQQYPHNWIQYDILAITIYKDKDPEYYLLNDVFI